MSDSYVKRSTPGTARSRAGTPLHNITRYSTYWGLCDLGMGCAEFGTVSLREMADFVGRAGLGIERDKFFEGTAPISRYIDAANEAGHIVENIPADASAAEARSSAAE